MWISLAKLEIPPTAWPKRRTVSGSRFGRPHRDVIPLSYGQSRQAASATGSDAHLDPSLTARHIRAETLAEVIGAWGRDKGAPRKV